MADFYSPARAEPQLCLLYTRGSGASCLAAATEATAAGAAVAGRKKRGLTSRRRGKDRAASLRRENSATVAPRQQIDCESVLYPRVLALDVCKHLIGMSYERTFSLELENVDDQPVVRPLQYCLPAHSPPWLTTLHTCCALTLCCPSQYQIDLVRHGWVADSELWAIVGPLFDSKLKPLLSEVQPPPTSCRTRTAVARCGLLVARAR